MGTMMITDDFKKTSAYEKGFYPGDVVEYGYNNFKVTYVVDERGIGRSISDRKRTLDFSGMARDYILVKRKQEEKVTQTKQDGGPSSYYDHPFKEWTTVNDMVEYFSQKLWGSESWIFKDILKAVTRWGEKEGTTKDYDARKIIYYGLRLLRVVSGKKAVADYLKELSNNEQFKG